MLPQLMILSIYAQRHLHWFIQTLSLYGICTEDSQSGPTKPKTPLTDKIMLA